GGELGLPVFLYGELAEGRGPAFFRAGGPEGLARRVADGEVASDYGPARLDKSFGAVLVGARRPLIAFNGNLRGSLEAAREVAAVVRERDGGYPGVRALGLELPSSGLAQVSMNVEDYEAATLHEIADSARERMAAARALVEQALHGSQEHTYGVYTGFGRFVSRSIPEELTEELQLRLLRSHACGVGEPYPPEIVRAVLLLRANALAKGYSGARAVIVEQLVEFLNRGLLPHVPSRGSVGASGDLA